MNNNQYNEQRYNKRKQWFRLVLGMQQLINYPVINLIWILLALSILLFVEGERKLSSSLNVAPLIEPVFNGCMRFLVILIPLLSVIGIIQLIGHITAVKDEADMCIIFGDKRDVKNYPPILMSKKTDRKTGVTKREFHTIIPMERWQEKKESICDRMNIHIVGEMTYGGTHRDIGNRIVIESAKGRIQTERGVLYDDTF